MQSFHLLFSVNECARISTSAATMTFPAGILIGEVSSVKKGNAFQTALTVEVTPAISSSALKEVFVISDEKDRK